MAKSGFHFFIFISFLFVIGCDSSEILERDVGFIADMQRGDSRISNFSPDSNISEKDGIQDECEAKWFYLDLDHDGLGDPNTSVQACENPDGYVENMEDDDDTTAFFEPFTFAIVGDLGWKGSTQESVADLIKSWDPAFIMTLGDNDMKTDGKEFFGFDNGVGNYFHNYIYKYHGEYGEGSSTWRFFPALGDHDGGDGDSPVDIEAYLEFFSLPNQEMPGGSNTRHGRYYEFRWNNVHFFMLNTWRIDNEKGVGEPDGTDRNSDQAKWLKEHAAASNAVFKIVVSHWPAYGSNKHWQQGDSDHLRDWDWKAMGIDVMFSGNDHGYERVELPEGYSYNGVDNGGFVCITSAGGGSRLYEYREPYHEGSKIRIRSFGASRLHVKGRTLIQEYIDPDGKVLDTWTLTK